MTMATPNMEASYLPIRCMVNSFFCWIRAAWGSRGLLHPGGSRPVWSPGPRLRSLRDLLRRARFDRKSNPGDEMSDLEEGKQLRLDFAKLAKAAAACPVVLPVAVQNADTDEVILVAYANELALRTALETRSAVFWSTSRNELWEKGKTSGETFDLVEVRVNCEQNSLLYRVRPRRGGICHTKNRAGEPRNCYYRRLSFETGELENLDP